MENITIGQLQHFIVNFASVLTAGGIICGFALRIGKIILDNNLKPFSDRMDKIEEKREEQFIETNNEIKNVKEELHKNSLNTLKNTICNDNIPLSERIIAGKEYIDKGGNGAVKIRVHQLEEEYETELKKGNK